ncbi:HTH domain-containing protein [Natrinema halophilum]|uniref:Uncharacterized protein n=1 Tax=Natrinema halophilum TaxID=1699371 RepID=A0A7D5K536_9EURY|nr:HTH domain-containing protein [Natrinema halophilum]QLG48023.1 hypothetical protein HYG82_03775 [Natrinema halophilum]
MTDSATDSSRTIRIELFLRKRVSADTVEVLRETVDRSRRLKEQDGNVDVHVETWSSTLPAIESLGDSERSVTLTVDAFQDWADREGYTLRPAFERRETPSRLGHDPVTEIRVPVVCVAVYVNDDLTYVAPCSDGDRTYSVDQCLAALERDETAPFFARGDPHVSSRDWSGDCVENAVQESE